MKKSPGERRAQLYADEAEGRLWVGPPRSCTSNNVEWLVEAINPGYRRELIGNAIVLQCILFEGDSIEY